MAISCHVSGIGEGGSTESRVFSTGRLADARAYASALSDPVVTWYVRTRFHGTSNSARFNSFASARAWEKRVKRLKEDAYRQRVEWIEHDKELKLFLAGRLEEERVINRRTRRRVPTTLYRLYDASGDLLYVGIAGNPGRRFEQHAKDKPWWALVSYCQLEHFDSRPAAASAERQAINRDAPRFNVAGYVSDAECGGELSA